MAKNRNKDRDSYEKNVKEGRSFTKLELFLMLLVLGFGIKYANENGAMTKIYYNIKETFSQSNPIREHVDVTKPNPKYIKPYIENEVHPNPSVRSLPVDLSNWPPGEMGIGVTLDDKAMPNSEIVKRKAMYKNHAFEEYVSEMISLKRSLPDFRGQWCRDQYDGKISHLEKVSIIICFHNEAWSTLLRSVHSIINRTPKELLHEILLVDDKSDKEHLGSQLDEYVKENFDPSLVKIVRQEKRQGLMRSRMTGIRTATANVLVFLDSHIEAGIGWLEPMLQGIYENPKLITSPVIDAINDTTFFYRFIEKDIYGLMNWRMEFEWHELDRKDIEAKPNKWAPHLCPIMAGGLFAIRKDFFEELGYYDEGMEVWGGENYELSFKAWMCGGIIEIAPCSRVGHVFRTWSPYKVDEREINTNYKRVAEVWMDEFKYLFYSQLGKYDVPFNERIGKVGDVAERKTLRKNLKCQNFKWFLDTIIAGRLPYHDLIASGEIRNPASGLCIDKNDRTEYMDHPLDLYDCHNLGGFQYWWLNKNKFLLRYYMCIGVDSNKVATVTDCGRAGHWTYDKKSKLIRNINTGLCMSIGEFHGALRVKMIKCNSKDENQHWEFSFYNKAGLPYQKIV